MDVSLDVGADAIESETILGIKALDEANDETSETNDGIPELDPGMTNVTRGKKGFRFLPKGMKFKEKIKLNLPYNKSLLPADKTGQDIKTYYCDEEIGRWLVLERVTLDT
ncbi:hypothetical protein QUF54_04270, partial [Candidatus Marithioploca araucensis]|nr:hypothetical protein [Candidatus Marithioploca araucensis]